MEGYHDLAITLKSHQEFILLFTLFIMGVYGGFRLALSDFGKTNKASTVLFIIATFIIPAVFYVLGMPSANASLAIVVTLFGSRNIFHLLLSLK
jgi:hypothetical protein